MTTTSPLLRRLPACALLLLALAGTPAHAAGGSPALVPLPAKLEPRAGRMPVDAATPVFADEDAGRAAATWLMRRLEEMHGVSTRLAAAGVAEDDTVPGIAFTLDAAASGDPEGYVLDASPQGVRIRATDARGLFHGAVTLWQLLERDADGRLAVPAVRIEDAPRFRWRGLMLDSARHFQDVAQIKQLIEQMALHKLNVLHWHLTDDQGWRIEIHKHPDLARVGGCRIPAGDAGKDASTGEPRRYCGYYTQAQIRDIVAYAAERHVTVVPEVDMPGHVQAVLAAYPRYGALGDTPAVSNEWGVHRYLFNVEEPTFAFIEEVLDEVLDLLPSRYIHVGGDEAVKDQWKSSPAVQSRMRELGIDDETQLQAWFIARLQRYLAGKGRRLLGWDEILDGGLPPDATVMSWRGMEGGIAAARQGHDVVMAPSDTLYLDYLQTDAPDEAPGRPTVVSLRKVYAFDPVPLVLPAEQRRHVLGLQANVWTEHMRTWQRVQHAIFPRIAALAENGWTPRERKDYAGFLERLPAQLARYRASGIDYADTPLQVQATAEAGASSDRVRIALSNPLGYPVRYTTDGSEPGARSPLYRTPIEATLPVEVRAAAFAAGTALAAASRHRFDAASLLTRSDEQLAACPSEGSLPLRLEDDGPADGERAIFDVDIFNPCWLWARAPLEGVAAVEVRAGRIPYFFQLAHDEPNRRFVPAASPHGELLLRGDRCEGPPLASVPLPAEPGADGFTVLRAALPPGTTATDLCIVFTGDTRPAMWVLDRATLLPR